jgi:arylsulfatase A-like enzyme
VSLEEGGPWELYDLDRDRTELDDVAALHPDRVEAMAALWDAWARDTGVVPRPQVP